MGNRYVHTNIIARDWEKLSRFYQRVFGCEPVPPQRDLRGDWLDRLTGIAGAHIVGEHLRLPGWEEHLPTLEIFSYIDDHAAAGNGSAVADRTAVANRTAVAVNRPGLAHLAFEVDDVAAMLQAIKQEGGGQLGELVTTAYPNNVTATLVYALDPEGNILELQSWKKNEGEV